MTHETEWLPWRQDPTDPQRVLDADDEIVGWLTTRYRAKLVVLAVNSAATAVESSRTIKDACAVFDGPETTPSAIEPEGTQP